MLICKSILEKEPFLQAQLCEKLWLCHTSLCGYALRVTDEQMSGWWPSITPNISSCRPWWPCDIGVCRAEEGDLGLFVSMPSSMFTETWSKASDPEITTDRCMDVVSNDDFDFEPWRDPQNSHTAGTHNHTHIFIKQLTFSTAAFIPIGPVNALGSILAGSAGTLINVDLTHGASKPWDRQT